MRGRGPQWVYYTRAGSTVAVSEREQGFFDGIDTTLSGMFRALGRPAPAGAAEALAAVIRETGTGLILGSRTAGQAAIAEEFPLKNGQRLRVATAPIQLGDGSSLSLEGVNPDITVQVTSEAERTYYADAFRPNPDHHQRGDHQRAKCEAGNRLI